MARTAATAILAGLSWRPLSIPKDESDEKRKEKEPLVVIAILPGLYGRPRDEKPRDRLIHCRRPDFEDP